MRIAIAGVTGHTGRVAADLLLAAGHQVRVLVRDAAKGADWAARGATVAVADLTDVPAVTAALRDVDAAFLLVPPNATTGDFRAWQKRTGAGLAEAVAAAAPRHVVLLSSVGAQHPDGTGPIAGLHPLEQALRALPATGATFVRASSFMENLLGSLGMLDQGLFPSFTPAGFAYPMIATADIAHVVAARLTGAAPAPGAPAIVELGSGPYSAADVAAALSALRGSPVQVAEAPVAAMAGALQGFGFPPDIAALYQEMTEGLLSGRVAFEGVGSRETGPTTLEAFLRAALA